MDTGILHLTGRSCHDNKSQRADPFVCITSIIAGKTKLVKDRFSPILPMKPCNGALCRPVWAFWENWGNARTDRIRAKDRGTGRGKEGALREF